jgi:ABC-type uncharacterized transport system permease subunit
MLHYIHLYFSYMKRSFISRMEYKKDTFIAMMGFFIENAASIASIYFIVNSIPSLFLIIRVYYHQDRARVYP